MYVKIRRLDKKPGDEDTIITISKLATVQNLRQMIFNKINIPVDKQKLYYKGKLLVDDHRVMDYDIQLNDVIQLMIVAEPILEIVTTDNKEKVEKSINEVLEKATSKFYKLGDLLDVVWPENGAWIEARLEDVLKNPGESLDDKSFIYRVKLEHVEQYLNLSFGEIRLRSHNTVQKADLKADQIVLVNHNIENPLTRGCWYDLIVKKINRKNLIGTIIMGNDRILIEDTNIKFCDEVFLIEKPKLLTCRFVEPPTNVPLRKNEYYCEICEDVSEKPCKDCGCSICSGKEDVSSIILCDECNYGFHIKCLTPPLEAVPEEVEWYCPSCKVDDNKIVKAGESLKFSKKKAKMASSSKEGTSRDWGHGMACVGRSEECTIVPKHHSGPIPGVEVGTCWKFRLQVSGAGIHRPHVAGIHGRETDCAYSLVLSGGYVDDVDNGNEFIYSGSGGRDLSGNKRVSEQTSDQSLTRMNKALALNCNVPLNVNGAEATNWKGGKPVRVVRNYKLAKHSKYAPKDGNRYDGIYKVVKYYPEKGKSGFLVWRYVLRRDDPAPSPWSKKGQDFEMIYPPGYLEAQAANEKPKGKENLRGAKRVSTQVNYAAESKRQKIEFELPEDIAKLIAEDKANVKVWNECNDSLSDGKAAFLAKVKENFKCFFCQELLQLPVTTECKHNVCKDCLKRSFSCKFYECPSCRFKLGSTYKFAVNENLSTILLGLFPGYGSAH